MGWFCQPENAHQPFSRNHKSYLSHFIQKDVFIPDSGIFDQYQVLPGRDNQHRAASPVQIIDALFTGGAARYRKRAPGSEPALP